MRKIIAILLLLVAWSAFAQNQDQNVRPMTASQAIQANNYTILVGIPTLGTTIGQADRTTSPLDVRFPWDVLYLPNTFSEASFDVSKGYFGDMIRISWTLQSNFNLVSNIAVFRRVFTEDGSNEFVQIANTAPIATEYEDEFVEGGVLYEYKIEAQGIGGNSGRLLTFIDGIGYRSPTAIVTGSVNFEGGNPVKDVVIRATAQAAAENDGTGLSIPSTGELSIEMETDNIATAATLQAFVKPQSPFTASDAPIRLFSLETNNPPAGSGAPIETEVSLDSASNQLTVSIGGNDYIIEGFYPSGDLLADGSDELIPVTDFDTSFVHITVQLADGATPVLLINGRILTAAYAAQNVANYPGFVITEPTGTISLTANGTPIVWSNVYVGGQKDSYIDEIRVWKNMLDEETIRTDYRRFINGNNTNLLSYLRANEGVGSFAYDLSREGFTYHNNHGSLYSLNTNQVDRVTWISGEGNVPTQQQLGVLGVTDENGNYEITAIPYSGTGESFNITPLLGVHEFSPNQQLVFLGQGSEVVNSINFTDISSFSFTGRVIYDSRNVFLPIAGAEIFNPDIDEVGYNQYEAAGVTYEKGEYWRNDNGTPTDATDDFLENYATVFSEGVNVYIDGEIVLDENNTPVTTGPDGIFTISVPIGNHYISITNTDHEFEFNGRFPAASGTFAEFFEDNNAVNTFIDNTKVTLTGRVVGGSVEASKPYGFGADGFSQYEYEDSEGIQQQFDLSSKNNIGVSNLVLGYKPPIGNITNDTRVNFSTNETSGEYEISLLPVNYKLESANANLKTGVDTGGNDIITNVNLLAAEEDVNLKNIPELIVPLVDLPDGTIAQGNPYHLQKSVIYRSIPSLRVIGQTSESEIEIDIDGDGNLDQVSTAGFQFPIYRQFLPYIIDLKRFEEYTNYDTNPAEVTQDPITDGELLITNNLALDNTESIEVDAVDQSIVHYSFKGGMPRISAPYTRNLSINYRIQGVDYPAENVLTEGIILGGESDGSQNFLTAAPDIPDLILRDPPGSGSSATIENGESISFIKSTASSSSNNLAASINVLTGVKLETGGGLAGPVIASQSVNEGTIGIGLTTTSENAESVRKTYTFSQSISTSSEPDFVGSQGDLYIGQSVNYAYGSYDDIFPSSTNIPAVTELELTNDAGESIFIGKQKSMFFNEEPSETFYVLSQKAILETTIPELQAVVTGIINGTLIPGVDGIQTQAYYEQQIFLWRKTILENELSKYTSLNNAPQYRTDLLNDIQTDFDEINASVTAVQAEIDALVNSLPSSPAQDVVQFQIRELEKRIAVLQLKKLDIEELFALINEGFSDNISFDSGVGGFTRSVQTTVAIEKSTSFTLETDAAFEAQLGVVLNGVGLIGKIEGKTNEGTTTTLGQDSESSTTVSYTFSDSDPDNLLSVDVVNLFDGNGPVFSTVGGRTSCPYEDAEKALFYDPATYDPDATSIEPLPDGTEVLLSVATQRVEVPLINVEVASVTNIPESQNAEFVLLLENNSVTESDADFVLKVDNTTNPNNAIINIEPNGTIVSVPYGVQTPYALTLTKSVSDVFVYDDIRILLQSFCDGEAVSDDVFISATFVPACSSVAVLSPPENWVYNIETAYNLDGTTNPLQIDLGAYNLAFNSFEKIDLEYRLATAPNWNRIQTYYTTQAFFDTAVINGETEISLIDGPTSTFPFDIVDAALEDGVYEIRARTSCVNGTEFVSESIPGTVDLTAPRRFNAPSPQDGILSSGDDIKASFNEDIFYNSAISQITIKGRTNQLPINNSVSVRFDGILDSASIVEPDVVNGDFSLEFWMLTETTASTAIVMQQFEGLDVVINGSNIDFQLGGETVSGPVPIDGLFHHYTFTYDDTLGRMSLYIDDTETEVINGLGNIQYTNSNDITLGGEDFVGNIHDLRLWSKPLTLADAFANIYTDFIGNERNLIGYWPMSEGRGDIARDKSRFNNMIINANWDIKPKGDSYLFENGQYQTLDNVGFVQMNDESDATLSFWIKTTIPQEATIFSNGRGDGTDLVQANGLQNKWAVNIAVDGNLVFANEGVNYPLTTDPLFDADWHHVVLLLNRNGALQTYVDGEQVSSNPSTDISGFSGNNIWLGARGQTDNTGAITIDREFEGLLDEVRLWNTVRNVEQITRDQYLEISPDDIGLLLYARMNEPDPPTGDGPTYFHAFSNGTIITSEAVLNTGTVNYNADTPPIKPEREVISFQVNRVINGDEMILEPVISNPAAIEGQILDITVHRMFDAANNRQESPITWTAFVQRNNVSWFAPGFNEVIDLIKEEGEDVSFDITLVNQGGTNEPYTISNIPSWLTIDDATGVLIPNSTVTLTANISNAITSGDYTEDIFLETDFGYDQKLQVDLKVLAQEPDWDVNPDDYEFSMNVVGRVNIDGVFSDDSFDRIGAFVNGAVRGSAALAFNASYQEYFVFLTIYSNESFGENISFRIWDASQGSILPATIDALNTIEFQENNVLGSLSTPSLFENTGAYYQTLSFNEGWTWVSMNVTDTDFQDLDMLTSEMLLETSDRMTANHQGEQFIELYYKDLGDPTNSGWSGTISSNNGLNTEQMYKMYFDSGQPLTIEGFPVDLDEWVFDINENWNWLPYPFSSNHSVDEAMALFNPTDGDVLKSQTQFAIYDPLNGWSGSLNTLSGGSGYMLRAGNAQEEFSYPTYLNRSSSFENPLLSQSNRVEKLTSYPNNMNMVIALPEGYHEVFAYNTEGVLKGYATNQEIGDQYLSFMTIYGDATEDLTFYVGNGNEQVPAQELFQFNANEIYGTIRTPVTLTLFENGVRIYPNPFDNDINLDFNLENEQDVSVEIYNVSNQRVHYQVLHISEGNNSHKIDTNLASGVYFMQIKMTHKTLVEKIIKK